MERFERGKSVSRAWLVAGWVSGGLLWCCYGDKAEKWFMMDDDGWSTPATEE